MPPWIIGGIVLLAVVTQKFVKKDYRAPRKIALTWPLRYEGREVHGLGFGDSNSLRDRRRRLGQKMLVKRTDSGDFGFRRHPTWEMSA
jgi:hypothetical protein